MKNNINKISFSILALFYFIFVFSSKLVLHSSNDTIELLLYNKDKFGIVVLQYIIYVFPLFVFVGYGYLSYINNLEKGILAFHKYRAKSSYEIFLLNSKFCFKYILCQTGLILLLVYFYSFMLKIPFIFNTDTIFLWLLVLTIVSIIYLFLLLNIIYSLMEGIVALILIVSALTIFSILKINILYLLVIEIAVFIFTFIRKGRAFN